MIESGITRKIEQAKNQDWRQHFLARFLNISFRLAKICSLTDITSTEALLPRVEKRERRLWTHQVERLINLGFHAELGMSEDEYREGIPAFQPQPPRFKGRFDLPILVDPRVSLQRQLVLLKVKTGLTPAKLAQLSLSERQQEGNTPYQIWVHIGKGLEYKKFEDFNYDERALTAFQGFALLREVPDILQRRSGSIALAGSSLDSDHTVEIAPEDFLNYKPVLKTTLSHLLMKAIPDITRGKN